MSAFGTYLYTYASLCLSALVLCSGIFLISCLAVRKRSGVSPKRQALWFVTLWYLISLSMILFTTGHSGENDVNLYPLRSIYSAVADTGVSLSQLIVLTSGLFVPFGFLLMLVIRRRPLQYFIPLFSLVYALALEGLHLLFGYGAFDIDRPIFGMLGALFGCGLCAMIFPSRCGGRRNVWHYAETAVPVALTAALLISYSARPYGYLPCETGSPYEVKRAAVDCSMIADMLPSKLELYSLAAPSGSTDAAADDVFSALGFTRDRSYKSAYDSVLLYRSTDAQALLWCYNARPSTSRCTAAARAAVPIRLSLCTSCLTASAARCPPVSRARSPTTTNTASPPIFCTAAMRSITAASISVYTTAVSNTSIMSCTPCSRSARNTPSAPTAWPGSYAAANSSAPAA